MEDTATIPPGRSHERVGAFTDAVFAIAMTLLVIEIPRPEGPEAEAMEAGEGGDRMAVAGRLWDFLAQNSWVFLAFVVAFLMLWAAWRQHHKVFDQLTHVPQRTLNLHVPGSSPRR
ncbi:TMEM175 family protein [Streptosporangium sp. V21-05]|uniref:TMEM175 family protein n=1 Tax=Streptosporangium sp. V21-05 TaxID=3446115 RepID=UPI003F52F781